MDFIFFFGASMIILILAVYIISIVKQSRYEKMLLQSGIYEVDSMKGSTFEDYLATLLKGQGYKVRQTPTSGDYGADLIISANGIKIAVQAKRYKNKVGIKAVQEISSARNYYGVDECWVVTNNYFTKPAINLAHVNNIILIDRDQLAYWMLDEKGLGAN